MRWHRFPYDGNARWPYRESPSEAACEPNAGMFCIRRSLLIARFIDHFSARDRAQGLPDPKIHRILDKPRRAICEGHVDTAGVAARGGDDDLASEVVRSSEKTA